MTDNLEVELDKLLEELSSEEHSQKFHQKNQNEQIRFLEQQLSKLPNPEQQKIYMQGYFDKMKQQSISGKYSLAELSDCLLSNSIVTNYLINTARKLGMNQEIKEMEEGITKGRESFNFIMENLG